MEKLSKAALIDPLNKMLRGEISAVETYNQALGAEHQAVASTELRQIELDHRNAAEMLETRISEFGGVPDRTSGAWGVWAKAVQGTAKVFGDAASLKALKEGEEHGLKDYESMLEDEGLDPDLKSLIAGTLLPKQRAHIPVIDRLLNSVS